MSNNTGLNMMSGGDVMATADIGSWTSWPNSGKLTCGSIYVSIDGVLTPTAVSKVNPLPVLTLLDRFAGTGMEWGKAFQGGLLVGTTSAANAAFNGSTALTLTAGTQTALATAGVTTLNFNLDPSAATNGNGGLPAPLVAGMKITLWNAGTPPTQAEDVIVASTYTTGTAVPISATKINHTGGAVVAQWGAYDQGGPNTGGMSPSGLAPALAAVWDPETLLAYAQQPNLDTTLLASAARTTTAQGTSVAQVNRGGLGVSLFLNITVAPNNTETLAVSIQEKDPISGNYVTVATFNTTAAGSTLQSGASFVYKMHPGIVRADLTSNTTNDAKSLPLPRNWRAVVTHSASSSWTYSLNASVHAN